MGLTSILIGLGVIIIAGSALSMALDVWNIRRELLPDIRKILLTLQRVYPVQGGTVGTGSHTSHVHPRPKGSFAIWEWCDGVWILRTDLASLDVNPGLPPSYKGAFNGYKVKSWVPGP